MKRIKSEFKRDKKIVEQKAKLNTDFIAKEL
jgi:hypothetical protein